MLRTHCATAARSMRFRQRSAPTTGRWSVGERAQTGRAVSERRVYRCGKRDWREPCIRSPVLPRSDRSQWSGHQDLLGVRMGCPASRRVPFPHSSRDLPSVTAGSSSKYDKRIRNRARRSIRAACRQSRMTLWFEQRERPRPGDAATAKKIRDAHPVLPTELLVGLGTVRLIEPGQGEM